MSKKYQLVMFCKNKLFLSATVLFVGSIALAIATQPEASGNRAPASLEDHEGHVHEGTLPFLNKKLYVHQKLKPPISIKIDKLSPGKIYAGNEFEITAEVSSKVSTTNVRVEWKIPQFMEVVSGETHHSFDSLEAGEKKTVRLVLKSHSEENQQIHIVASAPYGNQTLSAVDQFNSTDEEDLRNAKADLVKRHIDYSGK